MLSSRDIAGKSTWPTVLELRARVGVTAHQGLALMSVLQQAESRLKEGDVCL